MRRILKILSCLMLVLASGLSACSPAVQPTSLVVEATTSPSTETFNPTGPTLAATTVAPKLTLEMLRGASYSMDLVSEGQFKLTDGEFREPAAPGSASEIVVGFEDAAMGDLNRDGMEDAVVLLKAETGGTGRFYYLYPVLSAAGAPVVGQPQLVGDRIQLVSLTIVDAQIVLELVQAGPNDPMCCPSQRVKLTYTVTDGQLSGPSQEILGRAIDIPGSIDNPWL